MFKSLGFALACAFLLGCGGSPTVFDEVSDGSVDDTAATSGEGGTDAASSETTVEGGAGDSATSGDGGTAETGATCAGTTCGTLCTDLKTDPKNCGACGKVVCHDEACGGGVPVCAPGLKACGGSGCLGCKNLQSDPGNCGGCGKTCSAAEVCSKGSCVVLAPLGGCDTGLTRCGSTGSAGACVDLKRDLTNCGACGKNCAPGEFCADGTCTAYVSAPGCTKCPCDVCKSPTGACCRYADGTVCASTCPGGA